MFIISLTIPKDKKQVRQPTIDIMIVIKVMIIGIGIMLLDTNHGITSHVNIRNMQTKAHIFNKRAFIFYHHER